MNIDENKFNLLMETVSAIKPGKTPRLIVDANGTIHKTSRASFLWEKFCGFFGGKDLCKEGVVGISLVNYLDYALTSTNLEGREDKIEKLIEVAQKFLLPKGRSNKVQENETANIKELAKNISDFIKDKTNSSEEKEKLHQNIASFSENYVDAHKSMKKYETLIPHADIQISKTASTILPKQSSTSAAEKPVVEEVIQPVEFLDEMKPPTEEPEKPTIPIALSEQLKTGVKETEVEIKSDTIELVTEQEIQNRQSSNQLAPAVRFLDETKSFAEEPVMPTSVPPQPEAEIKQDNKEELKAKSKHFTGVPVSEIPVTASEQPVPHPLNERKVELIRFNSNPKANVLLKNLQEGKVEIGSKNYFESLQTEEGISQDKPELQFLKKALKGEAKKAELQNLDKKIGYGNALAFLAYGYQAAIKENSTSNAKLFGELLTDLAKEMDAYMFPSHDLKNWQFNEDEAHAAFAAASQLEQQSAVKQELPVQPGSHYPKTELILSLAGTVLAMVGIGAVAYFSKTDSGEGSNKPDDPLKSYAPVSPFQCVDRQGQSSLWDMTPGGTLLFSKGSNPEPILKKVSFFKQETAFSPFQSQSGDVNISSWADKPVETPPSKVGESPTKPASPFQSQPGDEQKSTWADKPIETPASKVGESPSKPASPFQSQAGDAQKSTWADEPEKVPQSKAEEPVTKPAPSEEKAAAAAEEKSTSPPILSTKSKFNSFVDTMLGVTVVGTLVWGASMWRDKRKYSQMTLDQLVKALTPEMTIETESLRGTYETSTYKVATKKPLICENSKFFIDLLKEKKASTDQVVQLLSCMYRERGSYQSPLNDQATLKAAIPLLNQHIDQFTDDQLEALFDNEKLWPAVELRDNLLESDEGTGLLGKLMEKTINVKAKEWCKLDTLKDGLASFFDDFEEAGALTERGFKVANNQIIIKNLVNLLRVKRGIEQKAFKDCPKIYYSLPGKIKELVGPPIVPDESELQRMKSEEIIQFFTPSSRGTFSSSRGGFRNKHEDPLLWRCPAVFNVLKNRNVTKEQVVTLFSKDPYSLHPLMNDVVLKNALPLINAHIQNFTDEEIEKMFEQRSGGNWEASGPLEDVEFLKKLLDRQEGSDLLNNLISKTVAIMPNGKYNFKLETFRQGYENLPNSNKRNLEDRISRFASRAAQQRTRTSAPPPTVTPTPSGPDYHKILGVAEDASKKDIEKAYKKLARRYHPDKDNSPEAAEKFKKISEAYQQLTGIAGAKMDAVKRDQAKGGEGFKYS